MALSSIAQKMLINVSGCEWPGWKWTQADVFQVSALVSQITRVKLILASFSVSKFI